MAREPINLNDSALMPIPSAVIQSPLSDQSVNLSQNNGLLEFIRSVIVNKQDSQEPFYVLDLGLVASLMNRWATNLPNVRPFYAIKCNPDHSLLSKMAALGTGFDCASRGEIEAVLSLGVSSDRIIFANACKPVSHIRYAAQVGVNLTTFDSIFEVPKIQKHHPSCELLIRIKAPEDAEAIFPLGKKFGALQEEVEPLLRAAQAAQLRIVGVSFHVGSGAKRLDAFRSAIEAAREVFDEATRIGLPKMRLLNIGGGFTAGGQLFEAAADVINLAMREYFGDEPGLTVIAEPGRFFAGPAFTLATNIIGKRVRGEHRGYWINDGIYGSIKFYDEIIKPTPLAWTPNLNNLTCRGDRTYPSTVFGPTCAAVDTVLTDHMLPELQINDWLIFPKMGAYTKAMGSNFNGFNTDSILTYSVDYSNFQP